VECLAYRHSWSNASGSRSAKYGCFRKTDSLLLENP
jgi:hypothetical protein